MTRFGYALTLASASVVAAALFVRPPSSPPPFAPKAPTRQAQKKVVTPTTTPMKVAGPVTTQPASVIASVTPTRAFTVDVVAFAAWGSGPGELGHALPSEANPEAPMSLTVDTPDDDGSVWVLDQFNRRVVIYDAKGAVMRTISMPIVHAQDLAVDPRGGVALLDRWAEKALVFVDDAGVERSRVALAGAGVDEVAGITALFRATDGYWVEYDHRNLVRIALPNGAPDSARMTLEGRRVPGSSTLLRAARDPSGYAVVSSIGGQGFLTKVPFPLPVLQLEGLDADAKGNTFVTAHLYEEGPAPKFELLSEKLTVVALSPAGTEIGRFDLPGPEGPEQQFRPIVMSKQGALYHLHVGVSGVTIRRAR